MVKAIDVRVGPYSEVHAESEALARRIQMLMNAKSDADRVNQLEHLLTGATGHVHMITWEDSDA